MTKQNSILNAVKLVGITTLMIGIVLFAFGFFGNGYMNLTPIGIGTIVGAVFIFIMGMFFVATEEMLNKAASR